jgi:hypothetical protein
LRSKGCLSNKTVLATIFKLAEAAEKNWRRLNGHNQVPKIILGVSAIVELLCERYFLAREIAYEASTRQTTR